MAETVAAEYEKLTALWRHGLQRCPAPERSRCESCDVENRQVVVRGGPWRA